MYCLGTCLEHPAALRSRMTIAVFPRSSGLMLAAKAAERLALGQPGSLPQALRVLARSWSTRNGPAGIGVSAPDSRGYAAAAMPPLPPPPPLLPPEQPGRGSTQQHWLDRHFPGLRHWLEDQNRKWWIKGLVEGRCKWVPAVLTGPARPALMCVPASVRSSSAPNQTRRAGPPALFPPTRPSQGRH